LASRVRATIPVAIAELALVPENRSGKIIDYSQLTSGSLGKYIRSPCNL